MKPPIQVIVSVELDPSDPTVELAVSIQVKNFQQLPPTAISVVDSAGTLRPFVEIQKEYAKKAVAMLGNPSAAQDKSGLSRQTLARYLTMRAN